MFITAQDAWKDAQTKTNKALLGARLITDLLLTIIKENNNQLKGTVKKQNKALIDGPRLSVVIAGLKIAGIALISLVWFGSLRQIGTSALSANIADWGVEFITPIVALLILPFTFLIVRKASPMSQWNKVVWAYGLGCCGVFCYLTLMTIISLMGVHFYPQLFDYTWAVGLIYLAAFCVFGLRFKGGFTKLVLRQAP
ncbi:MAG TPA: hypothetical protein VJ836_02110 [Candidatus Saccharimonadales bacterium]|nr:hypothetical protein [Candidatus Saccharimonadales bacterium]